MIIKYSEEGAVEWAKSIGEEGYDRIKSVVEISGGGYIVAGTFESRSINLGNSVILTSEGGTNGMVIKYTAEGNTEWAKGIAIGGRGSINSVSETRDGGYIVVGEFSVNSIDLGNGVVLHNADKAADWPESDGMLIKYNREGVVEWAKALGGNDIDHISSVVETRDGGYIVGGYFHSSSIDLGNGVVLHNADKAADWPESDGMLIKYNTQREVQWAKAIGGNSYDEINSVSETRDGGYIVGGSFWGNIDLGKGVILNGNSIDDGLDFTCEGMIIKYTEDGDAEWAKSVGKNNQNEITLVSETKYGDYIAGGNLSGVLNLENGVTLANCGILLKISAQKGAPEIQELVVENERKEFNITTNVKEIDGIKGGTISGEDTTYEIVKYGDSNTKEIIISPYVDYEIIGITVNGQEYNFTPNEDGSYTMPTFTNITEDKHIEVTYALKDNKIIINKVDSETKAELSGATFKLDQIEEREVPESTIGALINNGQEYIEPDLEKEVTDVLGELKDNGQEYGVTPDTTKEVTDVLGELTDNGQTYNTTSIIQEVEGVLGELQANGTYYFIEENEKYVPTNSKTYTGGEGVSNSTANSYIIIDLTNKTGKYAVVVNAEVSSESGYDCGYAAITETQTIPGYGSSDGQFIDLSGTVSAQDYKSNTLEGGKIYYLHLGYKKDVSVDREQDRIVFNSIKVYETESKTVTYNFIENEGKYESNNGGQAGTVANSYIPIDLTNKEGEFAVVVNAEISSDWEDYGYATITESTERAAYNLSTGRFVYISGTVSEPDYISMSLEGGKTYYLHLGYYKNANIDSGDDKFTINSVNVYEADPITYEFIENEGKYESNNQGKSSTVANSYIPIDLTSKTGKYALIVNANISSESADRGYATVTENTTRPSYNSSTGRFIYISGTGTSVTTPTDYITVLEGGKVYYLHLGYRKDYSENYGDDKFTVNSVKLYDTKAVTYNFVENEGKYESIIQERDNRTANSYIPIDLTNCEGKYNLIVNANISSDSGDYGYVTITEDTTRPSYSSSTGRLIYISGTSEAVTTPTDYTNVLEGGKIYYLHLGYYKNETTSAGDDKFTVNSVRVTPNGEYLYHTEVMTNSEGKATTQIPFGKYAITEIVAPVGYELNENSVVVEFRADENHEFTFENNKLAKVIVHHYIKGTETKVAESDILQDKAGYPYTALPKLDLEKYEVEKAEDGNYIMPENATGQFISGEQEVIYYYEEKQVQLVVNHYLEGTETPVSLVNGEKAESSISYGNAGEEYTTEAISPEELSREYELVEMPSNSTGRYEGNRVEVTYYYKKVVRNVIINKFGEDGLTPLEGAKFIIVDKNATTETEPVQDITNSNGKIEETLEAGDYIITEIEAPVGYQLPEKPSQEITISKDVEEISLDITNIEQRGNVIVHHYIENSTVPVLLADGTQATDIVKTGKIGDIYVTKPLDNTDTRFELISEPINSSGNITEEDIEVIYYYTKPEVEAETTIEKKATDKIISKDTKVYYEVKFRGRINWFDGKAKIKIVDTLPYPIIIEESELAGGIYDTETKTITWEEEINNLEVLGSETIIERTKILNLKYNYENINETTGKMENKVNSTLELLEPSEENLEEYVIVKEDKQETVAETLVEIPTEVKVHHYIYDAETNEYTTVKLAEDEIIEGIIGQEYTTESSTEVAKNYRCINQTPEKHEGKMTDEIIEVNYYYELITPTIENIINKTASANKTDNNGVAILTKEDGEVTYNITYNVKVKDYIGRTTIEVIDSLPARIDVTKSELAGGAYSSENNTIIWTEEIGNIDTFTNGEYIKNITKEIKVVYENQDVTRDLVNTVTGKTKVYYPETHTTKPGEEQREETSTEQVRVKQEYKVTLNVEKVWEDNNNLKGKRPESVTIVIKGIPNEGKREVLLNPRNRWVTEITDLPKYDGQGNKIVYEVIEKETVVNDLEYYELPEITMVENQTEELTNYVFTVENAFKLMETDLKAEITKQGSVEITSSKQEVEYTINFKAEVKEYIGEGKVKIVDTLPYKIDKQKSYLARGVYDDETQTITWEEELPHINTDVSGESYKVDITKQIKVVYKDIDVTKEKMINKVNGRVELYETEVKDEKETTVDTNINVDGKVIVRYVDKDSGKDIDTNYNYEIIEKVGTEYKTEKKEIENYDYIESTNNEIGIMTEETQEVIYYYSRMKTSVLVKYQDVEGNELLPEVLINGQVLDTYTTEQKEIENYRFVGVTGNIEGTMTKEQIVVIYMYEKIPTKVIVKHLEKVMVEVDGVEIEEEKEIIPSETIEGFAGEEYITERKVIANYRKAEPEPENKTGKMTEEEIEVKYYYEKIPSGKITVKYVDIDTEEEITYKGETGERLKYGYEIKGYVGEEYETEEKEIPYYMFINNTENIKGILTEKDDIVTYYYRKLDFNISVEKTIKGISLNGEKVKVTDNKLAKIEIKTSQVEEANLEVSYSIKVKNEGEIKGKAKIAEIIPEGYEVIEKANYWKAENGILETEVELEVGKEKELIVKLRWKNNENNLGAKDNIVEIRETQNEAEFEEISKEDNSSKATVVVSIKTGEVINISIKMLIIIALTICLYMQIVLLIDINKGQKIKNIKFFK